MSSDAVAIGRIARNLIDNAIKYTDQGVVRVETRRESDGADAAALMRVTDTGRGIPEHERGQLFEEFYQLDNPSRDRSQGVGLGLAIVQRLCELIGAAVTVDSQVGRGTPVRGPFPAPTDARFGPHRAPLPADRSRPRRGTGLRGRR